eukprot:TRINITY_DN2373_c1_g1_i1.p1 TRINITY_DN2373_c1_g1~~TRINITY_DN2373_c1_g1_i1.p1  ORF type:complete len:200 (-),score=55.73 TRINITY_DN2373_c1_g1_i1:91-690(-)
MLHQCCRTLRRTKRKTTTSSLAISRTFYRDDFWGTAEKTKRETLHPMKRDELDQKLSKYDLKNLDREEEVKYLDGWLFGKKVVYINPKKPVYEQMPDNAKYIFGERPPPPGFKRLWEDWEILLVTAFGIALAMKIYDLLGGFPDNNPLHWAEEELTERMYYSKRELQKQKREQGLSEEITEKESLELLFQQTDVKIPHY